MDLHEDPHSNIVTATFELPGLKKEDVNIDVHHGHLTVSGETVTESEKKEEGYAIRERRVGKFTRSLKLPEGVKVCFPCSDLRFSGPVTEFDALTRARRSRRPWRTAS